MPYIYGIQPISEALAAKKTFVKIWFQKGSENPSLKNILSEAKKQNIPFQFVPPEKIKKLIPGKATQGMVALITDLEFTTAEDLVPSLFDKGEMPFLIVLDKITDVRNFGSIARTAECLGVHGIIFPALGSAALNEDAVKASAGALLHIPLCREFNLKKTFEFVKESGISIIAIHEKTNKKIHELNLKSPIALLLGNEESGISKEYLKYCDDQAKIPMSGKTASLNVSNAAAIALYEAVRQRHS
ncbi:MAG: 23S rRNA (guanosine(2251)-2'-O)-methyltransferase RlmB [Bacteroidia bacterium]|nr:23S rRNA (guanosine(2251)-2'-O)-methyltransferase RlmB [Bacteroidia bacterium]